MEPQIYIHRANSSIIATAIHDGHQIPTMLREKMFLPAHIRIREEDPYTADIIDLDLPLNSVVIGNSRFVADLNRAREACIYKSPEDAWGLTVWATELSAAEERGVLTYYDKFYSEMKTLLEEVIANKGYFIVLDVHSYNYRREGPTMQASPVENPEINIGTIHNQPIWRPVLNAFINALSTTTINGRHPDVRENVKFRGGAFSQWICSAYGQYGCVLSIEFKKTFMDEWTGRINIKHLLEIKSALKQSISTLSGQMPLLYQAVTTRR